MNTTSLATQQNMSIATRQRDGLHYGTFPQRDAQRVAPMPASMMTREEAEASIVRVKQNIAKAKEYMTQVRREILHQYERRAWQALGYETFEDFMEGAYNYQRSYAYQLVESSRTEQLLESAIADFQPIYEYPLRVLASVPVEHRVEVYKDAKTASGNRAPTAKNIREAIQERGLSSPKKNTAPRTVTLHDTPVADVAIYFSDGQKALNLSCSIKGRAVCKASVPLAEVLEDVPAPVLSNYLMQLEAQKGTVDRPIVEPIAGSTLETTIISDHDEMPPKRVQVVPEVGQVWKENGICFRLFERLPDGKFAASSKNQQGDISQKTLPADFFTRATLTSGSQPC